jgi:hypothetical protein
VQGERQSLNSGTTSATRLVGREQEVGLLLDRWEQTKEGRGQAVLLTGEPGIGKSRLAQTLVAQVAREGSVASVAQCSPYHQNSAFYSVIDVMQRALQFDRNDTADTKTCKLAHALTLYNMADALPLFTALLSLPAPTQHPPLTLTPQKQKELTIAAMVQWWLAQVEQQATVAVWEDIHWADPSTLEFLTLLLEQAPTSRLLVVFTARPEFVSPWSPRSHFITLTLNRLSRRHTEAMIAEVAGATSLPAEVTQQILAKTDGVPLFVEELTKSVIETVGATGRSPLSTLAIPATLQDSLMTRLDRLNTAKELAQLGATLGREFSYDLLHAVSSLTEDALQQGLRQLVESELVYQRGLPPQAQYTFKHALIQDAAYQSLLKSRRQQLHQQIAHVLEEKFPETKATQPEILAHHYTEANLIEQAISYWQQAGELASKRLALKEAIAHLDQGMALINALPPSLERNGKELDLRTWLGTTWMTLKGWAAPEVWTSLQPALGFAKSLSRRDALLTIYWGLSEYVLVQGRVAESLTWVNDMLAAAEASGDPYLLIVAHWEAGIAHFWRGDFAQSHVHDDKVLALYDEERHHQFADLMNTDPTSDLGVHGSLRTWLQGYPDRAVQLCEANDAHARRGGNLFDLGWVLTGGGLLWDFRREPVRLLARVEEAERLGRTYSLPYISDVLAQVMKGIARLRAGQLAEGAPQLRGAIETWHAYGGELWTPYWRAVLAEGLALSGDLAGGLQLIEESLMQIARPGWEERWALAEILRLKGWMLTLQGDLAAAEETYLASLDVAREQQAKSWELRTTTNLARLWRQQGKQHEARTLLSEIYNWFTEGFDTKDLQEAKALLEELRH